MARRCSRTPIIFITGHDDIPTTVLAMKPGALEFLTNPFDEGELLGAVRKAVACSARTCKLEADRRELRECYAALSHREREVMDLIVVGLLNKQVGCELGIGEITVKVHRRRVMEKMKARSFADLVRMSDRLPTAIDTPAQWTLDDAERVGRAKQLESRPL
jgi:FixJ family two-component response regulator